eukprot:TRINITY_DN6187_c0_g3_i1.p1 TRINITY_DN6187_c0_g3~~TRINITY_DN6187_c0_g3_i1.p1  ORF type:complete len:740 (+),score=174.25 TRINITY_DN6187_c0_g3_i1:65-2284(+)
MAGETSSALLLSTGESLSRNVLGSDVAVDEEVWHYCMLFPQADTPEKKAELDKAMSAKDMLRKAKKIFLKRAWVQNVVKESDFANLSTKREFYQVIRSKLSDFLTGPLMGCKVDLKKSFDGDEILLRIALHNLEAQKALAANLDLPVAIKNQVYMDLENADEDDSGNELNEFSEVKEKMPTANYSHGKFWPGPPAPAYAFCNPNIMDKLSEFRQIDVLRIIQWRIESFINVAQLIESGAVNQFFPLHNWNDLQQIKDSNWSNITGIFTCDWYDPSGVIDKVRSYYGEEVAFFFHFLLFYTRSLVVVALLSVIVFLRRLPQFDLTLEQKRYIAFAFTGAMLVWSSVFVEKYKQQSSVKIVQWGMLKWSAVAPTLPSFSLAYRGSKLEMMQNGFHWALLGLFILETVVTTGWISNYRIHIRELDASETVYGLDKETASLIGKTLITVNIKVVAALWGFISPKLTNRENHKTAEDLKYACVSKLFIVKTVVYFYPFLYIAFAKKYFEGCADKVDGCVPELEENLAIFFFTNVATTLAMIVFSVGMTKYSIYSEISKKRKNESTKPYFYEELQAKCPVYVNDTDDFMDLIIALSFVMLFSAVLPVMAALAFMSNVVTMKLLAWRMVHANQRPMPRGQIGIGVWVEIIRTVATLAVVCNVALVCFAMHPIEDCSRETKLLIFILAQNIALGMKSIVTKCLADQSPDAIRIEEVNAKTLNDMTSAAETLVQVPETPKPKGLEDFA